MSDGVLSVVDMFVALEETPARTALVKAFAKTLGFKTVADTLAAGRLTSERKSSRVSLGFHIDSIGRDDHAGERRKARRPVASRSSTLLFAHIGMGAVPSIKAPKPKRREAVTAEMLFDLVAELADDTTLLVSVDATLKFAYLQRNHPVLAPPLVVDGNLVRIAGAEYRGARSGEEGLQRLRWSESTGDNSDASVYVSYGYLWEPDALDLTGRWKREEARCLSYIAKVI